MRYISLKRLRQLGGTDADIWRVSFVGPTNWVEAHFVEDGPVPTPEELFADTSAWAIVNAAIAQTKWVIHRHESGWQALRDTDRRGEHVAHPTWDTWEQARDYWLRESGRDRDRWMEGVSA